MTVIGDFLRAAGQMLDARFVSVLLWSLALTLGLLAGLSLCAGWMVGLLPESFELRLGGGGAAPSHAVGGCGLGAGVFGGVGVAVGGGGCSGAGGLGGTGVCVGTGGAVGTGVSVGTGVFVGTGVGVSGVRGGSQLMVIESGALIGICFMCDPGAWFIK